MIPITRLKGTVRVTFRVNIMSLKDYISKHMETNAQPSVL